MVDREGQKASDSLARSDKQTNGTQLLIGIDPSAKDTLGQLFFATLDQPERTPALFAARVGDLRAGTRVVSHQTLKPFAQILAIGRVVSSGLSAVRSATSGWPMDARMVGGGDGWKLAFGVKRSMFAV